MSQPRDLLHNVNGRLFQAALWRKYAAMWNYRPGCGGERDFVEKIIKVSKAECIRRARINCRLAHRLNRRAGKTTLKRKIMFTKQQCINIAYALSFERSQDRGHDESTISIAKTIEEAYPGLLAEKKLDHLLRPAQ